MKGPSSGSEAGKKKGGGIFFFSPLFILFRTSVDLMMAMCIRKDDLCYRVRWFKHWSHLETAHRHIRTDYLISKEDPLEEGMATHSSILAWRIPWTEEPGGLQSVGSQTVGHNWVTKQPTTSQVDIKLTIATMFFELHLSVSTRQVKCRTACSVATLHCSDWVTEVTSPYHDSCDLYRRPQWVILRWEGAPPFSPRPVGEACRSLGQQF